MKYRRFVIHIDIGEILIGKREIDRLFLSCFKIHLFEIAQALNKWSYRRVKGFCKKQNAFINIVFTGVFNVYRNLDRSVFALFGDKI